MSRSAQQAAQLAGIHRLRTLVERVAEARAADLSKQSRAQEERCFEADQALADVLDGWHAALTARRFDPATMELHRVAVTACDAGRAHLYELQGALERDLAAARSDHCRAEAARRCAADQLARAERLERRRREERVLALRDDANALKACRG